MGKYIDEIKAGGVKGCLGLDQMDWGGEGGKFYELWKCAPCCGSPDLAGCLNCCFHWNCLGYLTYMRTLAWSQDNECAVVPHCVPLVCCCGPCTRVGFRYNLRHKAGVSGNLCGDFMCVWCCGICAFAQELRSMPVTAWQMFPNPPMKAPKMILCV
mmetsp:Transcript_23850/g.27682  ORF Transcript_23850/g.27682 Transcript_23850/m.27682 type:complete len:156 (+) Transcript_23850:61-528(+)